MNRKTFLKLITFVPISTVLSLEKEDSDKKLTIYGYDWEYKSFNYRCCYIRDKLKNIKYSYFAFECNLYPNKSNKEEFIHFPSRWRKVGMNDYQYDYKKGIKTIYPATLIDGMTYVKNGKVLKIKKEFSTHTGFCDKVCMKIEFIV